MRVDERTLSSNLGLADHRLHGVRMVVASANWSLGIESRHDHRSLLLSRLRVSNPDQEGFSWMVDVLGSWLGAGLGLPNQGGHVSSFSPMFRCGMACRSQPSSGNTACLGRLADFPGCVRPFHRGTFCREGKAYVW